MAEFAAETDLRSLRECRQVPAMLQYCHKGLPHVWSRKLDRTRQMCIRVHVMGWSGKVRVCPDCFLFMMQVFSTYDWSSALSSQWLVSIDEKRSLQQSALGHLDFEHVLKRTSLCRWVEEGVLALAPKLKQRACVIGTALHTHLYPDLAILTQKFCTD